MTCRHKNWEEMVVKSSQKEISKKYCLDCGESIIERHKIFDKRTNKFVTVIK